MAHLSVSLLGPFQATLGGAPITNFESDKVRALLAYLGVEADRPHRRDALAGLLWPDYSNRAARTNLRNTLANLRHAIGDRARSGDRTPSGDRAPSPRHLLITRETIQFNAASDHWLDVAAFRARVEVDHPVPHQLEKAVALYRGAFLEGFFLKDSPAFEDWSLLTRERLHRQMLAALRLLAGHYGQRGDYDRARDYAWREVELEPWREEAHQRLMRLLALSGQRGAALAQYETCRRLLHEELDVEPAEETTRLYEQIRDGTFSRGAEEQRRRGAVPAGPVVLPRFLEEEGPLVETPVFVARERELAQLDRFLDLALTGQGQVVFVTGEAGSGKTALVQAFARRAQEAHADLVVAGGNGNAHTGIGDPYLPFREILQLLTGDVEARWAAGTISTDHARRLWNTLPLAAEALLEHGLDLIDTFVPGAALVERAAVTRTSAGTSTTKAAAPSRADWLTGLAQLVERKAAIPAGPGPQQGALFEQATGVLEALARHVPLVLVLDDLQWADAGSIHLLFHLGRQLPGSRILIVGAYRPEEVVLGRGGERHPLEPVVNELQREFGDITVDLDRAAGRDFVEAFLDSESNCLGAAFRETLYRQTRGHPLFTIELLRGLQERGDLVQDREGRWVPGPQLDWETLPARVEAVIAERIGRLTEPLQAVLRAASVEGETFTAEVVARVERADEREMVTRLSGELDRSHRLVRAQTILRVDNQRLSRYRFRHILFQRYLYDSLDPVERAHLHEDIGTVLEGLYGARANDVAIQLAHHFQQAGVVEKAADYLRQAGTHAARLSANEEAIAHFNKALALLKTLPESTERDRQELRLQLALAAPHQAVRGYAAPETGRAYARAYDLCQRLGETPDLLPALWSLGSFYYARGEHHKSLQLTERVLSLARRMEDTLQIAMARWGLGVDLLHLGALDPAREHLAYVIGFYDPEQHHTMAFVHGQDPGVSALAWMSWTLWLLGYPDQAIERSQEALKLTSELDHPFTLGFAWNIAGSLFHQLRRENRAAQEQNQA
ncbi:MAG: AAA family ATPase, partial [Anaerolineae bacterium]|nr:AAA family ATPase [Anaerolineae bacterium]